MWSPFLRTGATKQTAVTSLMVLWTDVLVKVDDLGQEGGFNEKEAGFTERLSKLNTIRPLWPWVGLG